MNAPASSRRRIDECDPVTAQVRGWDTSDANHSAQGHAREYSAILDYLRLGSTTSVPTYFPKMPWRLSFIINAVCTCHWLCLIQHSEIVTYTYPTFVRMADSTAAISVHIRRAKREGSFFIRFAVE